MGKKTDIIEEKSLGGGNMGDGTKQPKKLVLFNILDILKQHTDENHRLSQRDIENILRDEYDMIVDRKTIKTSLMSLEEFGYEIEYSECLRPIKNKKTGEMEDSYILSDFYLRREFEDSELRLLIDSLLFSKHLPYSQCKELVEKIEKLSNKYFKARIKHISTMPQDRTNNQQLFYTIDILDEAISHGKKVKFKYTEYGTDFKQRAKKNSAGEERSYVVSPYQMAAKEGKYYLICNYDKYDDISNYRIDRIVDIELLDENAKPFEKLKGSDGKRLDLAKYMREHVYMYSSNSSRVKIRVVKAMISDVIDMFGNEVKFYDETEDTVCINVCVNEASMVQFAQSYAPDVEILEPVALRKEVKERLRKAYKAYE